jgi:hypothetical protein
VLTAAAHTAPRLVIGAKIIVAFFSHQTRFAKNVPHSLGTDTTDVAIAMERAKIDRLMDVVRIGGDDVTPLVPSTRTHARFDADMGVLAFGARKESLTCHRTAHSLAVHDV